MTVVVKKLPYRPICTIFESLLQNEDANLIARSTEELEGCAVLLNMFIAQYSLCLTSTHAKTQLWSVKYSMGFNLRMHVDLFSLFYIYPFIHLLNNF